MGGWVGGWVAEPWPGPNLTPPPPPRGGVTKQWPAPNPLPPLPDQSDHRGKEPNLRKGTSGRAIFGTCPRPPPPLSQKMPCPPLILDVSTGLRSLALTVPRPPPPDVSEVILQGIPPSARPPALCVPPCSCVASPSTKCGCASLALLGVCNCCGGALPMGRCK